MLDKITFTYEESEKQDKLFTPYHTKYDCMIKYNGKQFKFNYQCNATHTIPNIKDCMECLLLDASSFEQSIDEFDFANEFGYDPYEDRVKIRKIYKACERTYNRLHTLFTDSEIEAIENEIEGN